MSILMERMLTHWLTHINSSLCSRLVSYCMQSSSTQHPSSSPSDMVSKLTRSAQSHLAHLRVSPDLTTIIPATASPDPSLSQDGNFLHYKGLLYVPDNQDVQLDILRSHTTIVLKGGDEQSHLVDGTYTKIDRCPFDRASPFNEVIKMESQAIADQ